jgi:hypothetical protein
MSTRASPHAADATAAAGRAVQTGRQAGPLEGRLAREFLTMQHMVALYCQAHHAASGGRTCPSCTEFLEYAACRLEKCPYGQDKPTCANCPIHCYKREPREFARTVMRYAGPRMMTRHPWLALMHVVDGRRKVEHPMASRRRRG